MKIASNKLSDLYAFYKHELASLYDEGELYAIFELVCETYLNYTKSDVRNLFQGNLNQSDLLKIYDTGKALKEGTPVQYVLQEAWFYDLKFNVNASTLIPRPETEELVEMIIRQHKHDQKPYSILDIGTGSGCIPVTLKKHLPVASVSAIDISHQALDVAKKNARRHHTEVHFFQADILRPVSFLSQIKPFSVIVSNPPYITNSEAQQMEGRVLQYEPHLALFVDDADPIVFYKRIIDLCQTHLLETGYLFFELNPLYAKEVKNYADERKIFTFTDILNDMSGKKRFLKAQKTS